MRDTLEQVLDIDITPAPPIEPIAYGKGKNPYRAAIVAALQRIESEQGLPPGRVLTEIAERVVMAARDGDKGAAYHIADRLDGKPSQEVGVTGGVVSYVIRGPAPMTREEWVRTYGSGRVIEHALTQRISDGSEIFDPPPLSNRDETPGEAQPGFTGQSTPTPPK